MAPNPDHRPDFAVQQEELVARWTKRQLEIAESVSLKDVTSWHQFLSPQFRLERPLFVAGTDISFSISQRDFAVGSITVVILRKNGKVDLVFSESRKVSVQHPYIPTFLGFREAPVVSELLDDLPGIVRRHIDCLLLDGNGVLHPRGAGLACQVGVEHDLPTIGVSKALLCIDGLEERRVRALAATGSEEGVDVVGDSGTVWARALITGNAKSRPIYVSIGHKVSLDTATRLVGRLCEFRVPAPIRAADLHSRAVLRGEDFSVYNVEEFLHTKLPPKGV